MNYSILKKFSILITILLLLGGSIIPVINGHNVENKINEYIKSETLNNYNLKYPDNFHYNKNNLYTTTDEIGLHKYSEFQPELDKEGSGILQYKISKKIKKSNEFIHSRKIDKEIKTRLSGNIFYVGGNGPNNYSKIQDAIDNSSNGDTVFVYDDSSPYYENLILEKSIQLIGENKDTTTINGSKLDISLDIINITTNNVIIQGFSINYNIGDYYQAAILNKGSNNIISNCKIYNNNWIGIYLLGSKNSQINNCDFYNNLIAIQLVDSDNNIIKDCFCFNNNDDILLFKNSHNNKIINCNCSGNRFSGIHIQESSGNEIINCTIENGYEGIGLAYAPNTVMHGNSINNNKENFGIGSSLISDFICNIDTSNLINGKPIIYWINHHNEQIPSDAAFIGLISCSNITIKNLNISNNFQGMVCVNTSNSNINNCNFLNNGGHGLFFIGSSNNRIHNCSYQNSFFSGVYINYQSNSNLIYDNIFSNIQVCGFWIEESINNQIINHEISNCNKGISLDKSGNSILRENDMVNCGLVVDGNSISDYINDVDSTNTVNGKILYYHINDTGITIPNDTGQVILVNCTNCNISNLNLSDGSIGIELAFSSNNIISNNIINENNIVAIDLDCFGNNYNKINGNTISYNNYGIDVDNSQYNTIKENILNENSVSISLDSSDKNSILDNYVEDSYNGIFLTNSDYNQLINNTVKKCSFTAIYLLYSKNNILKNNEMRKCGLIVYGTSLSEYINQVDTSNKVNEKTLYYLVNENGLTIPNDAGQVVLINCEYCIVTDLNLCEGTVGVELAYSDFNIISRNTLNDNKFAGIYVETSHENIVDTNLIVNNSYGISMQLAEKNSIKNNKIQTNYYGVYISLSNNNIFSANNLNYNSYGIYLNNPSASNILHHNNFYYNGFNALDETENINLWDNGKKGNYWGDYKENYPNARILWFKGIWNTPYEIPNKENKDRYPLIVPYFNLKEKKGNLNSINHFEKNLENYKLLKTCFNIYKFLIIL